MHRPQGNYHLNRKYPVLPWALLDFSHPLFSAPTCLSPSQAALLSLRPLYTLSSPWSPLWPQLPPGLLVASASGPLSWVYLCKSSPEDTEWLSSCFPARPRRWKVTQSRCSLWSALVQGSSLALSAAAIAVGSCALTHGRVPCVLGRGCIFLVCAHQVLSSPGILSHQKACSHFSLKIPGFFSEKLGLWWPEQLSYASGNGVEHPGGNSRRFKVILGELMSTPYG